MKPTAPHYLLFTQANDSPITHRQGGRWKFVLEEIGTDFRIEEGDYEPNVKGERLQLLAVIRGLEAIDQPSSVTLVTPSKYVGRGIRSGIRQWKANQWQWEHFGQKQSIKHVDFWKRIDAALQIHRISCRIWQFDVPHMRTQGATSDPSLVDDESAHRSPFISSFETARTSDTTPPRTSTTHPSRNRITINEDLRKRFFDTSREVAQSVSGFLVNKVKPIGEGRAYGYAIN